MGFINHGDIKPDNIAHYPKDGKFQLTDFDAALPKQQKGSDYNIKTCNHGCYEPGS